MSKIFTVEELKEFNYTLLGKGAPVEKDDMGYNALDFYKAQKFETCDISSMYALSNILLKYCNTQLHINPSDMIATAQHYKRYSSNFLVTVAKIDEKGLWLRWPYSPKIRNLVKALGKTKYQYEKDSTGWKCRINWDIAEKFVGNLAEEGFTVDEAMDALGHQPEEIEEGTPDATGNMKMHIKRCSADYLLLKLDINSPVLKPTIDTIKTLLYHRYKPQYQSWEIDIWETNKLYQRLLDREIIPADSLKWWADITTFNSKFEYTGIKDDKRPPRNFQLQDVKRMLKDKSIIVGNDMGCGKTYEAVMAGESLPFPKLIICPPSLRLNWQREIFMVNPDADVNVLYSADEYHVAKDWTIIGYSSLTAFATELENTYFQAIVLDEAHFIKAVNNQGTADSQRANVALRITKTAEYVWPMTGTPKPNRNKDLWNILKCVRHPLTMGNYAWNNYGKTFCDGQKGEWGWDYNGSSENEALFERLQPFMIRHLKSEVLPDLKKVRSFIPCKIDLREYNHEIEEYLKHRASDKAEQLARLTRARLALARRKAKVAVDFAKDILAQDEQVIIVTNFKEVVNTISEAFGETCVKIIGGMSDKQKDDSQQQFNAGIAKVCVMNTLAGGVGLTLTSAYNTIFVDFDWTPGNMIQAEDRTCRTGQSHLCNIFYLYAQGAEIDEVFAESLTDKMDSINAAIDGGDGESVNMLKLVTNMLYKEEKGSDFVPKLEQRQKPYENLNTNIDLAPKTENKANKVIKDKLVKRPSESPSETKITATHSKNSRTKVTHKEIPKKDYKKLTLDQLKEVARNLGCEWKPNANEAIERMRITMALNRVGK